MPLPGQSRPVPPFAAAATTHTGVVFFMGDRAYKVKRPVDLGFLDFRTREARQAACRREVELNRRLAPDAYLGVADVCDESGQVCDHMVVMRRMPDDRRLSTLIRHKAPIERELRQIAKSIAAFHARGQRSAAISAAGTRDALQHRWEASFRQLHTRFARSVPPELVTETEYLVRRFLAGREPLFDDRIERGLVVDGHGDLLADDIFCLSDGPRILDCLEFDDQLRWVDELDDAAFLAMDLEHLGNPQLGREFLRWYVEFSGDPAPPSLLDHFCAYRAFVRAKVAGVRALQGDVESSHDATTLAELALHHLRASAVTLILIGGLPGTGKSTTAGALADRLQATCLSADRVRKELAGIDPTRPARAEFDRGIYGPEWTDRTYAELLRRAAELLQLGETVIVDASWIHHAQRARAAQVAHATHSDLVQLRCAAPVEVATARLSARKRSISDADAAIARRMLSAASDWPESLALDTTHPVDQVVDDAFAAVQASRRIRIGTEADVDRASAGSTGQRRDLGNDDAGPVPLPDSRPADDS